MGSRNNSGHCGEVKLVESVSFLGTFKPSRLWRDWEVYGVLTSSGNIAPEYNRNGYYLSSNRPHL